MIGILLGVFTISLGAKAFTPNGLPLTKSRNLTGNTAKAIGAACILLGMAFIADGVFGTARIIALVSKPERNAATDKSLNASPVSPLLKSLPAAAGWDRHYTNDRQCSAEFPARPEVSQLNANGNEMQRMTLQRADGKGFYALNVMPVPKDSPMQTLEQIVESFRENHLAMKMPDGSGFTLLSERAIEQNEIHGSELNLAAGDDKVSLNRIFLSNGSIYRANVVIDTAAKDEADVNRFFESIRFHSETPNP